MNLNVAARAGRWSARRWKTAVSAWLAFCVVAIALGSVAGTKMLKQADTAAGGTKKAEHILREAGFANQAAESVLVQSRTATVADPGFRAAVTDVERTVAALPQVQRVRSPLAPQNAGQVAHDRRPGILARALQPALDREVEHFRSEPAEVEMVDDPIEHGCHAAKNAERVV